MEQGRVLLAIALSFIIFLVWNFFFVETPPVKENPASPTTQTAPLAPAGQKEESKATESIAAKESAPPSPFAQKPGRTFKIETPLYAVTLSEEKGAIKRFTLKHYRERVEQDAPPKELISETNPFGTALIGFEGNALPGLENAVFSADALENTLRVDEAVKTLTFSWRSSQGFLLEKRYTFSPKSYLIDLEIFLKNETGDVFQDTMILSLFRRLEKANGSGYGFEGPSAMVNSSVEEIEIKKIDSKPVAPGSVTWWAIEDRYFMSAAIPPKHEGGRIKFFARENDIIEAQFLHPPVRVETQAQARFEYHLFLGPKNMKILNEIGHSLNKAVNFGLFDFIAKPCVWLMNQIYRVIPNYGVAIILLTILSKILLWPLGNKSYKSMADMKKLQPLMAEIREKNKNDKKKQQQEIMNLYRTYKINPLGGCLPMVAQIPVFFALYRMLYEAIELRHAPFFGWINDLSAPDRLFHFGFSIPFMQPPYGIPVLTLVMGATMLLQQKMSPPPGDPSQAKMMMLMPIVFTVIFINFSAGLVLYWLVNNLLSIGQQYYVTRKTA